jgi:hypothetical protein
MGSQVQEVKRVVCFQEVKSVIIAQRGFRSTNVNRSIWRSKNPHAVIGHIRVSPKLNVLRVKNKIFKLFFQWWINYGWYLLRHVVTVYHVHFSRFRQFPSLLPIYSLTELKKYQPLNKIHLSMHFNWSQWACGKTMRVFLEPCL